MSEPHPEFHKVVGCHRVDACNVLRMEPHSLGLCAEVHPAITQCQSARQYGLAQYHAQRSNPLSIQARLYRQTLY